MTNSNTIFQSRATIYAALAGIVLVVVKMLVEIAFGKLPVVQFNQLQAVIILTQLAVGYFGIFAIVRYLLHSEWTRLGLIPISWSKAALWTAVGILLFLAANILSSAADPFVSKFGLGMSNDLLNLPGAEFRSTLLTAVVLGVLIPLEEELLFERNNLCWNVEISYSRGCI